MTSFDRAISPGGLEALLACCSPGGPKWFAQLLSKWRPAGQESGSDGLRLAIRNGYLNFYRCGQSVARVCFGRGSRPRAEVHIKYVRKDAASGQHYVKLDCSGLSCRGYDDLGPYGGIAMLETWIAGTRNYAGPEKKFVDCVLAHNANAIDLEMGLPAVANGDTAPRMDLVVLEPNGKNQRIVFWEAKVMGDGRLRKRDQGEPPEVIGQLEDYQKWMTRDGHGKAVAKAYKQNCQLLVAFHRCANQINPQIGKLGDGIMAVADSEHLPEVDPKPRLLIDDRGESKSWAPHEGKLGGTFIRYVRGETPQDYNLRHAA
jgi:hypothetical protein